MKLKSSLLYDVLTSSADKTKYSKSYLNLKNVISLEQTEENKIDVEIVTDFQELTKKFLNFKNNIPLIVVEKYYIQYHENFEKFVYLEYKNSELTDLRIIDLFIELEKFYEACFSLSCKIADYYNLEIKLKSSQSSKNTDFL